MNSNCHKVSKKIPYQSCETTTLEKAAENANLRKGAEDYAAAAAAVAAAVNTAANAALAANHIFQD